MKSFAEKLYRRLEWAQFAEYRDNYDEVRFGPQKPLTLIEWMKWQSRRFMRHWGYYHRSWMQRPNTDALHRWMNLIPELEWLSTRLADDESRDLLVEIIAYRIMGYKGVRLPLGTKEYKQKRTELKSLADPSDTIDIDFMGWTLSRHDLSSYGILGGLYVRGAVTLFEIEQYAHYPSETFVEEGDVVIDGGGCYGDTATYFANKAGASGAVHVFEFVPSNLEIMRKNLELNFDLEKRVTIAEKALWNRSGQSVYVRDNGPGSSVSMEHKDGFDTQTQTVTIDDYVAQTGLKKVDFIKMDIEGAEGNALLGAEHTIRSMHPKLAICLYHSPKDFVRLPRLIDQYCPDYRFYLKHATMHSEETVLFANVN
ncbi:MAG: FkbM family methyltransferase [Kiritimatiellae bacterium]|nr:FkbM family methyltransferase [Kiritimatiellia bacterium]